MSTYRETIKTRVSYEVLLLNGIEDVRRHLASIAVNPYFVYNAWYAVNALYTVLVPKVKREMSSPSVLLERKAAGLAGRLTQMKYRDERHRRYVFTNTELELIEDTAREVISRIIEVLDSKNMLLWTRVEARGGVKQD